MQLPNSSSIGVLLTLLGVLLIHSARPMALSAQEAVVEVRASVVGAGAAHELAALSDTRIPGLQLSWSAASESRPWLVTWVEPKGRRVVADLGHE